MSDKMQPPINLQGNFLAENIQIKIIHRFLIIEACRIDGVKGVNYSKYRFKTCLKLRNHTDMISLKAFYSGNMVRFGVDKITEDEVEISIDKRMARKKKPIKQISEMTGSVNIDQFLQALRAVDMI